MPPDTAPSLDRRLFGGLGGFFCLSLLVGGSFRWFLGSRPPILNNLWTMSGNHRIISIPIIWTLIVVAGFAARGAETTMSESIGRTDFTDVPQTPALLVGFQFHVGDLSPNIKIQVVTGIRPIYEDSSGRRAAGEFHGSGGSGGTTMVVAKPGYAVAGLVTGSALALDGFQVTFMKIAGDRSALDPNSTYHSGWCGGRGGWAVTVMGRDGQPVTGIFGRASGTFLSLGLQYADGTFARPTDSAKGTRENSLTAIVAKPDVITRLTVPRTPAPRNAAPPAGEQPLAIMNIENKDGKIISAGVLAIGDDSVRIRPAGGPASDIPLSRLAAKTVAELKRIRLALKPANEPAGAAEGTKSGGAGPLPAAAAAFSVLDAVVTNAPQKLAAGNPPKATNKVPDDGDVFLIVTFEVRVETKELAYDPKTDFLIIDALGYAMSTEDGSWVPGNTSSYAQGTSRKKMLYLVSTERIQNAKIHFLGKDYPIQQYLKPMTNSADSAR